MTSTMEDYSPDTRPSSVYVAPLQIARADRGLRHGHKSSNSSNLGSLNQIAEITPPATPYGSTEDLIPEVEQHLAELEQHETVFHNFLRAYYPFNPDYALSSSTVTLALNEGDVILVHSIHTNGWADGTLLTSGARGWLPTNYCEGYDNEQMRSLLKALLNFWDLLRGDVEVGGDGYSNQDFMKGIIAGVRCLLENCKCLTRDSVLIKESDVLRKNRKALLSDLSTFVKTAKLLHDAPGGSAAENMEDVVDEMTLKAFKIVMRGVKFLDAWTNTAGPSMVTANMRASVEVPPTPPADSVVFGVAFSEEPNYVVDLNPVGIVNDVSISHATPVQPMEISTRASYQQTKRSSYSSFSNRPTSFSRPTSRPNSFPMKRHSASHRVSFSGQAITTYSENLASQRLSKTHDAFLSLQGSFIGRLQLQSRSLSELLTTTQQSATACRDLLNVVEAVWERDLKRSDSLELAKDAMYTRMTELVQATREIFQSANAEDDHDEVLLADEGKTLMLTATGCVRAAGDCVAKTKYVLEKIGDFEFEPLEFSPETFGTASTTDNVEDSRHDAAWSSLPVPPQPESRPPPPPSRPQSSEIGFTSDLNFPLPPALVKIPSSVDLEHLAASESKRSSGTSMLPPLPHLASPFRSQRESRATEFSIDGHGEEPKVTIGSAGSSSIYLSSMRESKISEASQTSTRATTPDQMSPKKMAHSPESLETDGLRSQASQTTLSETFEDTEAKVLEVTYAHELIYNKEGQITGGTLPALIERLTTHDATPDSMFVSTCYLTFRMFSTPRKFAQALVDRFEYVQDSPNVAGPVRLRVYNVFKGWLESHWRNDCDYDALDIILHFARGKLAAVLPGAGKRLAELCEKVAVGSGPLVPRMVSSIGKTNTSIATYIAPDTPLPPASISKSQMTALRNWKHGGNEPSILDFDAIELARQFTIKESKIFCSIMPEELVSMEWTKKTGSKAVNVRAMSTLSTDLATLVVDTILQLEDPKKRAGIIKQWVKIANKSLELNNYDSVMAIICSLDSSAVLRLKKTWEIVSQKTKTTLDFLKSIVDVSKNYAVLRQRLQNHVPPCLPFVGTYLTDLTFVDVGNQTTRQLPSDGASEAMSVINFDKHMKTAKIIGELQRFQIPYRLTAVPELQDWMDAQIKRVRSSDQASIQSYYRRSLLLEPREVVAPKTSPVEPATPTFPPAGTKDKFDFRGWTHSKDKSVPAS